MGKAIINIDKLNKRYDNSQDYSIKDVSFTIAQGDKIGVFGPNGAGKTTLISIMCKLISATSGMVNYYSVNGRKLRIGLVPQDLALYEELSAYQNLEYFGAMCGLPKSKVKERSGYLLSILGLANVVDKKVKTYSGGMKRRLNLAIGLIHEPEVVFLDEPTVGVDLQSKNAIMSFLEELNEHGVTIVYTSHHMSEAEEFCDRIVILDYGKLIAEDTLLGLFDKHQVSSLMELVLLLTGKDYKDHV